MRNKRVIGAFEAGRRAVRAATGGLAQAFHSSAGIWLTEETASRVISDESCSVRRPRRSDQPFAHMVTTLRSCNAARTSRSGSGAEPFKDHLIGIAGRASPLFGRAHRPGQERQAEDMPRDPGRGRRQIVDPIGDKLRPGAKCVLQMHACRRAGLTWPLASRLPCSRVARRCRAAVPGSFREARPPDPDRRTSRPPVPNRSRATSAMRFTSRRSPSKWLLTSTMMGTRPLTRMQRSASDIIRSDVSLKRTSFKRGRGQAEQCA